MFPDALRAAYLKVHVFFGTAIFLLAVAACLTGITEKALWTIG
jgi:cytochrome b-561